MRTYRVYRIDGTGKFQSAEWLEADRDETAIELARDLSEGSPCEVWQQDRYVGSAGSDSRARTSN